MIYSSIWKDIDFSTSAMTLDYTISGDTFNHQGYSNCMPGNTGVTINVNRVVEGTLNASFDNIETEDDFLSIINEIVPNSEAYKEYSIIDSSSAVLETYGFLYDWSYESSYEGQNGYRMSNPINSHCDPRMKVFFGMANSSETSYEYEIDYHPYIKVTPSSLYFSYTGGTGNLSVESKGNWTASTSTNWLSIDVTSHTGSYQVDNTTVVVSAASTDERVNRNGTITFVGEEGATAVVRIYQYGIILYVVPESYSYDWRGGVINVSVYHNIDFTISSNSDWLTPIYDEIPSVNGSIDVKRFDLTVRAEANNTGWTRTGVVTFSGTSAQATFTGTQDMRLDNKVIYKSPNRLYPYMSSYSECGNEWGADYLTYTYDANSDIGMVVFDNTVTKYNGLTTSNSPGVRPSTVPVEWVWMYTSVSRINGRGVASDSNNRGIAFAGDTALTAVAIDDHYYVPTAFTLNNLTKLPNGCFTNCYSINEFNAADSLREIGAVAFYGCSGMTAVTLNKATHIGAGAFNYCSGLTSAVIPDSVTTLSYVGEGTYQEGWGAFMSCSSLSAVTIGNGLTVLPDLAFAHSGLKSINVPSNIISIGESCFSGCTELSSVTLNNGLTIINQSAFTNCTALTSVNIPASVVEVDGYAFSGCSSLTGVTLDGPTEFYSNVFAYCTALTNVVISDNTTRLGAEMFLRCTSLSSVTIGSGVTIMSWNTGGFNYGRQFVGCSSLTEIYAKPRTAPALYDAFDDVASVGTLHYPIGSDYSSWISALPSGWSAVADL